MSDGISLSQELISDLLKRIAEHDATAQEDMMVNLQYLVAVAGYLAADYPGPVSERDELMDHLHAFMKHVCEDRTKSKTPQAANAPDAAADSTASLPAGKSTATDDPAVGIWTPE